MPPAKELFKHLMRDNVLNQQCLIFAVLEKDPKSWRGPQHKDLFTRSRKFVNLEV